MRSLTQPAAERPEVAVVRHPIADARNNVVGYELRFGGSIDLGDPAMDAKATSALLVDAFGDIGLEQLAGRHPAWVTIARNFLVEIGPPPVRPDRAVLQISAYPAHDDLLAVLQQLGRSGYTIALDAYDGRDDLGPLMSLCSIVRIDVSRVGLENLPAAIAAPRMQSALLDCPMAEVLDSLPFTEEIQLALLRREGPKGELLSAAIAYERGEFPNMQGPGVSLASAYRAALEWADDAGRAIA